jgi:hypothetical protein
VLILRHFAEHAARFRSLHLLSFQWLPYGEPVALLSRVGVQPKKENDNDTNNNFSDRLAESETTSTSATLGANHAEFRNGSLCGQGTRFYVGRFILDRYVELGNHCWRSRRLALPGAEAEKSQSSKWQNA